MNTSSARKESLFEENKGLFGSGTLAKPGEVFRVIEGGLSEKNKPFKPVNPILERTLQKEELAKGLLELMSSDRNRIDTVISSDDTWMTPEELRIYNISNMIQEELDRPDIRAASNEKTSRHLPELDESASNAA